MSHTNIEYELTHGTTKRVLKLLIFCLASAVVSMSILIAQMPEGQMKRIFTFNSHSQSEAMSAGHHLSILP